MEVPIEDCLSAKVYKPAAHRKLIIWGVIIAMYSVSIPFCYNTAGEARAAAIIQAQKLADERWETELVQGSDVSASASKHKEHSAVSEDAEFVDGSSKQLFSDKPSREPVDPGWLMSWFTPSKEQRRAEAEFKKFEKEFKERNTELPPLPPDYLPSAWAVLSLLASMTFHALFFLMCRWVPQFKASSLYQRATEVTDGCLVLIVPPPNRGKAEIVVTSKSSSHSVQLEFQRQKYFYVASADLGEADRVQFPNGVLTLSSCPVDMPISSYLNATGLRSELEIQVATERYGKNHLAVHIPSFLELLKNQLLSPLSMFQVFCAMLWLLDEYWTYTIWTLVMVVVFEASTVFQRTRTQKMLGGMAPKGNPIFAYRSGKWQQVSTKDLLPGDLISMSFHRTEVLASGEKAAEKQKSAGDAQVTFVWDGSVPCDCLILKGSAVVNEASLTGESIPQMKEALTDSSDAKADGNCSERNPQSDDANKNDSPLDINSVHRVNILFSGTRALTVDGEWVAEANGKPGFDIVHSSCIDGRIPSPPDKGMVAYVLRTGFGSSQGALMQMIEFSQQSVQGDSRETGYALLMLFIFALMSSGYVLYDGLQKGEKTTHEILLKCVIIITSVVPRQFPMQMAMAVNMALMALTKAGVFCTEPFRVPLAGKISHILFDKTGTLTTDQLEPVGIIAVTDSNKTAVSVVSKDGDKNSGDRDDMIPVEGAYDEAAMVLAACHSLVSVADSKPSSSTDGEIKPEEPNFGLKKQLAGDPIELAAVKCIGWTWDADKSTATPGRSIKSLEKMILLSEEKLAKLRANPQPGLPAAAPTTPVSSSALAVKQNDVNIAALQKSIEAMRVKLAELRKRIETEMCTSIQVLHRHHFSSGLQRMSVVCKAQLNLNNKKSKSENNAHFVLVKGSPEAIQSLAIEGSLPQWYAQSYERLARRGLRVLALACKRINSNTVGYASILDGTSRQSAECELSFVGFIAFECKVRADSAVVVRSLRESDHCVSMLTGDALLTSLHVAKKVSICDANRDAVTLQGAVLAEDAETYAPNWMLRRDDTGTEEAIPIKLARNTSTDEDAPIYLLSESHLLEISQKYNILTTEAEFFALASMTGGEESKVWQIAGDVRVFARMSPQGKATIIRHIKSTKAVAGRTDVHVMMCGDGGNDVGALKEADVGLALLVGHASANTTEEVDKKESSPLKIEGNKDNAVEPSAEDILNARDKEIKQRSDQVNKLRQVHMKAFQAKYTKESTERMQKEIADLTAKGEYMAMFTLMKQQASRQQVALNAENRRFMAMHGHIYDPKRDVDEGGAAGAGGLAGLMEQFESADSGGAAGGLAMIKPGDASVAAPFTSRVPSVRAVVDLIRQGRCTLLSALMQQEIMMLESTIYAYTLSALSLHNARSSERQMMASSWLIMTAAISFSYASPVDKMHPLRPLQSLFHPAVIFSVLGQAVIHIACMTLAVHWATEAMGPEKLKEVTEFFKRAKAKEIDTSELCADDDMMCIFQSFWMAPFMPNLLNSVVFLVETSQMIAVYFANYKGRPWMKGMLENHPLFLSVYICIAGVVVAAWEMVPQLNEAIQLAPFPDGFFRYKVVLLVVATIFGTLMWDRLCTWMFAPKVFAAMMDEAKRTTAADLLPVLMTAVKIVGVVFILGTGNILLMAGAGYYWWKSRGDSASALAPATPAIGI